MLRGNAVVGQSGGPTAAINATLAGVLRGVLESESIDKLYGAFNGVEGLLEERYCVLSDVVKTEEDIKLLENTPAAALGSCRKKLPDINEGKDVYEKLFKIFEKLDIKYFFYIGGNDSMDTVAKLTKYAKQIGSDLRVMGVPKTIDNDLCGTDHTPGYGSAAKFIATTMQEMLRDTAVYTVKAVTIVEIMGRDAGWLTAAAALPRLNCVISPDLVYLPEVAFSVDDFIEDVNAALEKKPNVVVAVSEGARDKDGRYIGESAQSGALDVFGHKYLSGTGKMLENIIREKIGCKVRSVELNLPQRCASHCASLADLEESVKVGRAAVKCAESGESGKMMCFERAEGEYSVSCIPRDIHEIANMIRFVPREFINERGNNVTDECLEYIMPLINGEVSPVYKNGLPVHLVIER
ncbi:MAG: 6-phosphofructokinase [Ruminococcaceae bacterium]|nr:6-phosphofructokinase [Oscillospiraceae bacterium]